MRSSRPRSVFDSLRARLGSLLTPLPPEAHATDPLLKYNTNVAALIEASPLATLVLNADGTVRLWNPAAEQIFGWAADEVLHRPLPIVPPEKYDEFHFLREFVLQGKTFTSAETVLQRKNGSRLDASVSSAPLRDAHGDISGVMQVIADTTDRKRAEEALARVNTELESRVVARTGELRDAVDRLQVELAERARIENRLRQSLDSLEQRTREITLLSEMGDLLQTCRNSDEAHLAIAQSAMRLFPNDSGALSLHSTTLKFLETVATWGTTPTDRIFGPDDCWALRRGKVYRVGDAQMALNCHHLGTPLPGSYVCIPMSAQGEQIGVLHLQCAAAHADGLGLGLTDAKYQLAITASEQIALALSNLKLRESLRSQAIRDPLTGLFNRRYMEESLEREIRRAARKGVALGIIMVDLDHFKRYNDTFGHEGGDVLLTEFGQLLQAHVRAEDIACRYGGEEFTLILPETKLDQTRQRAEQIRRAARHLNVKHLGRPLGTITVSAGVAIFPDNGDIGETVLRAADDALYQSKAQGRDRVTLAGQAS